jgi:ATP:ADP antiporter, AAA family
MNILADTISSIKEQRNKLFYMSIMILCMFSSYSILSASKDMVLIKSMGTEIINAVKFYVAMPCGLIFIIIYLFFSGKLSFNKLFLCILASFLGFFVLFALLLYPYHSAADMAIQGDITLYKILLKNWAVVSFYVIAELWLTAIIVFLFWQFANSTTSTDQAKTSYPIYILMSYSGSVLGWFIVQKVLERNLGNFSLFGQALDGAVSVILFAVITFTALIISCFYMLSNVVAENDKLLNVSATEPHYGIMKSLRMVFSSKYLRTIFVIILCCSIADSILEMAWSYKARSSYADVKSYISFITNTNHWVSILTLVFLLISIFILKKFNWLVAAMITPVVMMIAGLSFLVSNLAESTASIDTSGVGAVVFPLGAISFGVSKILKNSLFNVTKEMSFIPEKEPIRSQGRVIVIFLGKSLAGFVPPLFLIIFPDAGHKAFLSYLVLIFLTVSLAWVVSVRKLGVMYQEKTS